ncbi:HupE / UreJ protein [Roseovarius sp. THAF8]|uniref:HupE/UreJ family protein n=1 Tax=Roseovarius sp. THAF8 TaxID=2587846 RepID=UPI001267E922|nr:HupE/UreJ family protein [Roseovarius sp. THAF8]QFT95690.1 HupE / UreJ protein [Roseovarius sp. THAF8]
MRPRILTPIATLVAATLMAGPALAHSAGHEANGFLHGLAHPVFGPDHLLAMLAVGLWSGLVLPRRVWAGALSFMAAMAGGAALSWAGIGFSFVETVIVASVVAFGLLTLLSHRGQARAVTAASLGAIALFATAHGHAHATEAAGNALAYLAGFLISTALLHGVGIVLAQSIAARPAVQRSIGAGIAASGLLLMFG